jgi:Ca2+ transporting ATPase
LEQFKDQLVLILLGAAAVSFVLAYLESSETDKLTAYVEPIVILLILIANAVVGVFQESNAEKAIEALKEYSPDECKVIRDGQLLRINAVDLVPGDIVELVVGDRVPADCRILSIVSSAFRVDQSILTGESVSVSKDADALIKDTKATKQDQINMLFSGTTITVGKASAVVVQTGEKTAIGDIHQSITSQIEEKTPLKQALDDFGDQLAKIISVICLLVWLINIQHFSDPSHGGSWVKGAVYYFKIAVALAVAAIPEGLAVIITTCLALGTKRMAAQGAIVRKLRSVETLGCTNIICSDKTGTLTTNQMSVRRVLTFENEKGKTKLLTLTGSTYGPAGKVLDAADKPVDRETLAKDIVLNELSHISVLCNDSSIRYDEHSETYIKIGEPTEAALKVMAEKLGTENATFNKQIPIIPDVHALHKLSEKEKIFRCSQVNDYISARYQRLATMEFSRDRKSMSVVLERKDDAPKFTSAKKVLYVKGAPETVLERCTSIRVGSTASKTVPLTPALRNQVLSVVHEWADQSLRILGIASAESPKLPEKLDPAHYAKYESNLTFVGLVGMLDPPRSEVKESIQKCKDAGIRVIVITGDNKSTAESICREIGVFDPDQKDLTGLSYIGREFDEMSQAEKISAVRRANLFSRTDPKHKQELVDLLKAQGWVVAMTGDGVNDAPALKKADIGVAMGSGTDVAKLASDMVLADDNFATIVSAVEEGRSIYANTKQFIRYLISSNIGEVVR